MPNHIEANKQDFQNAIDFFQRELSGIRTGRASAALVEHVRVESYGQKMDLKSVASITIPDAKTIQIEPWDKNAVKEVEKALIEANLGMSPNVAGSVIRLAMPHMTEENRKQMVKALRQKEEQAKIQIRNTREKIKSAIQNDEKNKAIGEDEKRRLLDQLDKAVADWNSKAEKMANDKEKEVMTV